MKGCLNPRTAAAEYCQATKQRGSWIKRVDEPVQRMDQYCPVRARVVVPCSRCGVTLINHLARIHKALHKHVLYVVNHPNREMNIGELKVPCHLEFHKAKSYKLLPSCTFKVLLPKD